MDIVHSLKLDELLRVIFLRSYNELKFHITSRDEKMFRLSPGIKISILSKSGHSTFVLQVIKMIYIIHVINLPTTTVTSYAPE